MFKKYKVFSLLYLFLFCLQLIAEFYTFSRFSDFMKPFLLLALIIFFAAQTKLHGRFHRRLFTGLLLALLSSGLMIMSNPENGYWTFALSAALLGYVFYIRAFYLDFRSAQELDKKNARIAIAACSIFGMAFYIFLRPYLGMLKLPVMLYIFIICMMLMMAVFRNLRVNKESFNLILSGSILLLIAECLFAINHFLQPFYLSGVVQICFYMAAQYLIVIGGVERKLLKL
jgi:uncharacterized membrane protein YhhN